MRTTPGRACLNILRMSMAGVWPESAGGVAWEGRGLPEGDECVGDSRTSAGEGHLVDNPLLEVR